MITGSVGRTLRPPTVQGLAWSSVSHTKRRDGGASLEEPRNLSYVKKNGPSHGILVPMLTRGGGSLQHGQRVSTTINMTVSYI